MKILKCILITLLTALISCGGSSPIEELAPPVNLPETPTNPETPSPEPADSTNENTLIIFFSWSGHTRTVTQTIQELTGYDMVEIEVVEPYSSIYDEVTARARQELDNDVRPALKTRVANMNEYSRLIVGTPIWSGRLAPPVKSFLAAYDLSGKHIVPFCAHGGSGVAQSVNNMREVCPRSTFARPLAIRGSAANNARTEIEEWLRDIGVL